MPKSPYAIVGLALGAIVVAFIAPLFADEDVYRAVIQGLHGQIELMKWLGTAIIGGLATAVTTLFFALQRARAEQTELGREMREKLLESSERQIQSTYDLSDSIRSLKDSCRAKWPQENTQAKS